MPVTGLRLFLRDALEAAVAALGTLVITVPANLDDAKKEGIVISVAVAAAVIAVARRELLPLILEAISPKPPHERPTRLPRERSPAYASTRALDGRSLGRLLAVKDTWAAERGPARCPRRAGP
jgi:hypothetical protein